MAPMCAVPLSMGWYMVPLCMVLLSMGPACAASCNGLAGLWPASRMRSSLPSVAQGSTGEHVQRVMCLSASPADHAV